MNSNDLSRIQSLLKQMKLDGWLLYDFRASNTLALEILGIPATSHLTRRFFYFIPAEGTPVKMVNGIEADNLRHLPGQELKYGSHNSLQAHLRKILFPGSTVAMEYSPNDAIPYLSKLDAGMFEFLQTFEVNIVCSGDLITLFNAVWTEQQYKENIPVAQELTKIVRRAYALIKEKILANVPVNEYEVQQYIMAEFDRCGYITDYPPIVGVNENGANPHYEPTKEIHKPITKGDFVLIDLWAKQNKPEGVWADITWVGYVGTEIPEKYIKVFNIVREARDAGLALVTERFAKNQIIRGYEVDDAVRNVIAQAGYGEYFIHRTGHSITTEVHGSGPHMDNFETHDDRQIFPSTSFSIEPGIYLPGDFGVRLEIDVFIHANGRVEFTGDEKQEEIIAILA